MIIEINVDNLNISTMETLLSDLYEMRDFYDRAIDQIDDEETKHKYWAAICKMDHPIFELKKRIEAVNDI